MNDKELTKFICKLLVAAYIIYMGFMLLTSSGESEHKTIFIIIGIFFLACAVGYGIYSVISFIKNRKNNNN